MTKNDTSLPDEVDEDIYKLIDQGYGNRSETIQRVIDLHRGFVSRFQEQTGVNRHVLYDIYIDAVLLSFDHLESGKFQRRSKYSTYLFRLFYFKVIDEVRKASSERIVYTDELPEHEDQVHNTLGSLEGGETMKRVARVLESMCPECREFIMDWAYLGYDLEEIRARMGFDSPAKFSKFKFKCLKKFKGVWESLPKE